MSSNTSDSSTSKTTLLQKLPFRLAMVALGLIVLWFATSLGGGPLLKTGTAAPIWTLKEPNTAKRVLSLADLKGNVVVLDFWSVGCPPCMKLIGELDAVAREFQNDSVAVVGISAWGESKYDVYRVKQKRNLFYHLLVGNPETVTAYKVKALPTLYILDRDGNIAKTHQGYISRRNLAEMVKDVLND